MQYANALAQRGDTIDVIAVGRPGQPNFQILDGVNVYRVQRRTVNERGRYSYVARIFRFLAVSTLVITRKHLAKRYDLIHVHSVPDFLVFAGLVPKLAGTRVILDIHDILPEFYASKFGIPHDSVQFKLLRGIEKLSTAFADHVIIANPLWRQRLIDRAVPASKCTTIRNYPDPQIFYRRSRKPPNGKFKIVYPGTLNAHQGLDVALRALGRIANQIPDAEFHIYGEGPTLPALHRLSNELRLDGRVHFYSFLPYKEIAEVMSTAHLAVVPKRTSSPFGDEAESTKIMEFMALGVPVIITRTKIDSFHFDHSMVRFFESDNDKDLADAILELRRDVGLRQELVANATRYIQRNNWDITKQEYYDIVDTLVGRLGSGQKQRPVAHPSES